MGLANRGLITESDQGETVMKFRATGEWTKKLLAGGSIFIFFIMAFEVMIMISPFAFFFYSVFNPIFNWLGGHGATRWLTHFFLPHMILPPTLPLQIIRVLGSILFVLGFVTFVVCALQVYLGKLFKWGVATKGLYRFIRHPQYLALGLWGVGMAILWPRFIVLATLSVMFVLYYILAKDEERRMTKRYGDSYRDYLNATGMFLPRAVERWLTAPFRPLRPVWLRRSVAGATVVALVIGAGFLGRAVTLASFDFQTRGNVTLVSIMPEDHAVSARALKAIVAARGSGAAGFLDDRHDYLGYVMPVDYIMQGMIADTGSEHHLFKKHHTLTLIIDWVLHPFSHLRRSPMAHLAHLRGVDPALARRHHCPLGVSDPQLKCDQCPYRRVILVQVRHNSPGHFPGKRLLDINTTRVPVGFMDVDTRTGRIVSLKKVDPKTAWRDVPTPAM